MNWFYKVLGEHTHVRVFIQASGQTPALAGHLCFRNDEFRDLRMALYGVMMPNGEDSAVQFFNEDDTPGPDGFHLRGE